MGRAPCCEKVGLKKGRWTTEEDEILVKYIQANGEGSWRSLPKNAGLLRCGKSCRLRWINYLRTDLKRGNISAEEENTIVKLHASFGNRWSLIASHLAGRTDNEIKNYWNSHLSRKIYSFPKVATIDQTQQAGATVINTPKRKGGRTSRWAMKKNKSYPQKGTQKPKLQSVSTQHNNEAAVPSPPTPSLERECNYSSNAVADLMMVDSEPELGEARKGDEVNRRSEKKLDGVKESSDYDILGLSQLEGINEGSGALSISNILDSCLAETCGVLTLTDETENNDVVGVGGENERSTNDTCLNQMDDPESNFKHTTNREIGEWYSSSCSSMTTWDWESVIEFNNNDNINHFDAYNWEHKENLLTWLCEDHDWESDAKKLEETDPQMQNDLVAWFLS